MNKLNKLIPIISIAAMPLTIAPVMSLSACNPTTETAYFNTRQISLFYKDFGTTKTSSKTLFFDFNKIITSSEINIIKIPEQSISDGNILIPQQELSIANENLRVHKSGYGYNGKVTFTTNLNEAPTQAITGKIKFNLTHYDSQEAQQMGDSYNTSIESNITLFSNDYILTEFEEDWNYTFFVEESQKFSAGKYTINLPLLKFKNFSSNWSISASVVSPIKQFTLYDFYYTGTVKLDFSKPLTSDSDGKLMGYTTFESNIDYWASIEDPISITFTDHAAIDYIKIHIKIEGDGTNKLTETEFDTILQIKDITISILVPEE